MNRYSIAAAVGVLVLVLGLDYGVGAKVDAGTATRIVGSQSFRAGAMSDRGWTYDCCKTSCTKSGIAPASAQPND